MDSMDATNKTQRPTTSWVPRDRRVRCVDKGGYFCHLSLSVWKSYLISGICGRLAQPHASPNIPGARTAPRRCTRRWIRGRRSWSSAVAAHAVQSFRKTTLLLEAARLRVNLTLEQRNCNACQYEHRVCRRSGVVI